jgi:hypothetical protein
LAKEDRRPVAGERAMWRARLQDGNAVASGLVGMDVDPAAKLARQRGYVVEVITSHFSFDQRMDRMRLFSDSHNMVTQAHVG